MVNLLEEGKLTYASCSEQLFERLENHLLNLSKEAPSLHSATRMQVRLIFEAKGENQSAPDTDYQAICWLVNQNYITANQAALLIEELAKDVLETFLTLKEGGYEFSVETHLDELPKFCYLDLRSLIEYCQKKIRDQQNPMVNSSNSKSASSMTVATPSSKQPLPTADVRQKPPAKNNNINSDSGIKTNQHKPAGADRKSVV